MASYSCGMKLPVTTTTQTPQPYSSAKNFEWCVPNAGVGGRVSVADRQPLHAKTFRACRVASAILSSPIAIARWPPTLRKAGRLVNSHTGSTMKLDTSALRGLPVTRSDRRAPRLGAALQSAKPGSSSRRGHAVSAKPQEKRGSQRSKGRAVVVVGDASVLPPTSPASRAAAAAEGGEGRGRGGASGDARLALFAAAALSPPSSLSLLRTMT